MLCVITCLRDSATFLALSIWYLFRKLWLASMQPKEVYTLKKRSLVLAALIITAVMVFSSAPAQAGSSWYVGINSAPAYYPAPAYYYAPAPRYYYAPAPAYYYYPEPYYGYSYFPSFSFGFGGWGGGGHHDGGGHHGGHH